MHPSIEFFVNLSNYYGIRGSNINYVHHFGQISSNPPKIELDSIFSTMSGSLSGMLGLALYMGFNKITLVGCDYTYRPRSQGHFFEFGKFPDVIEKDVLSESLLSYVKGEINIETLTIDENYVGEILNHVSYEKLLSSKPHYQENKNIVSQSNLLSLDNANLEYKIY